MKNEINEIKCYKATNKRSSYFIIDDCNCEEYQYRYTIIFGGDTEDVTFNGDKEDLVALKKLITQALKK